MNPVRRFFIKWGFNIGPRYFVHKDSPMAEFCGWKDGNYYRYWPIKEVRDWIENEIPDFAVFSREEGYYVFFDSHADAVQFKLTFPES